MYYNFDFSLFVQSMQINVFENTAYIVSAIFALKRFAYNYSEFFSALHFVTYIFEYIIPD